MAWRTTLPTSEHKTTPKHTLTTFNNIIQNVQKTSNHLFNQIILILTKYLLLIVETPYIHIQSAPLLLLTLNTLLIIYSTLTKYILQLVESRPPSWSVLFHNMGQKLTNETYTTLPSRPETQRETFWRVGQSLGNPTGLGEKQYCWTRSVVNTLHTGKMG